jgi:hypothetical protein
MTKARFEAAATLLQNGTVLVAGGWSHVNGFVLPTEIYDPTTSSWSASGTLVHGRQALAIAPLVDGRVLLTGGSDAFAFVPHAEIYDPGLGIAPTRRPVVSSATDPLLFGATLSVEGSGFKGGNAEASSGDYSHNAPTNYPLVQLRRLDNGLTRFLPVGAGWQDTSFSSGILSFDDDPLAPPQPGLALITVFASGVPSLSKIVSVECSAPAIDAQPISQTLDGGQTAQLSVVASGATGYQWRKDGVPLTDDARHQGTHTALLIITELTADDRGTYDVVVGAACSSVEVVSSGALLDVREVPFVVIVTGTTSAPAPSPSIRHARPAPPGRARSRASAPFLPVRSSR